MTVGMERYTELLDKFGGISQEFIKSDDLKILKLDYEDKIQSKRVLESIVDIKSLLKVLEKRGILQYDDINVLKKIAEQFVNDASINELFSHYDQWLNENSPMINNFYSCGKSPKLLNSNKASQVHKIVYQYNNHFNIKEQNCESEDLCNENTLSIELCSNNGILPLIEETRPTTISVPSTTAIAKRHNYCKNKNKIIFFIIIILLIILVTVIWIFVKISYPSTAIVPKTDPTKISENQNKPKMPYFASNINVGFSTESRVTMNRSHYSTSTSLPHLDRQEELQNLIVSRISPRVGQSWIDISRGLGIQNSKIDEIEMKFHNKPYDYENMFKEAIGFYFSEHPSNWKIDLMQALQNFARRKDLKETVEKILIS